MSTKAHHTANRFCGILHLDLPLSSMIERNCLRNMFVRADAEALDSEEDSAKHSNYLYQIHTLFVVILKNDFKGTMHFHN